MDFSLESLEYRRLKQLLDRYVQTTFGKLALEALHPIRNADELDSSHEITAEAMRYLRENRVAFRDVPLLEDILEKLRVSGDSLGIPEIEAVQSFLSQVGGLREKWREAREQFPRLAQLGGRLPDLRTLAETLGRAVRDGEIDERYSPALARIRRALATIRSRLQDKLAAILRSSSQSGQTQDDVITMRNGRYVIPVRAEQKRTFDGVVHGSSSSGATVFMEPLATLELNNDLVRLMDDEQIEIARILAELTEAIRAQAGDLIRATSVWADLDLIFGKARFGREFDCARPALSKGGLLSLIRARHPLLDDNLRRENVRITPVSLDMDTSRPVLVISGPNAGGKTVVMKTVGLLSLMAQSGIPVPAEEATIPLFDRILADIGDQQSIANHLSTFSAHVLSIKAMIESATPQSLILLDEIGSSTEPGEGAALGRAVLEKFRDIGALTIATTHYNRLKQYAETTEGVRNAAMEFDEVTLQPTYRLLHGLAGASSGLKIAERMQMPMDVVQAAWSFLDAAEVDASHYVEELRHRIRDLERERDELAQRQIDFDAWKSGEQEKLKTRQQEEIAKAQRHLDRILKDLHDRATRELEQLGTDAVKRFQRKLEETKTKATREIQKAASSEEAAPQKTASKAKPSSAGPALVAGSTVRVGSLGVTGTITAVMNQNAEVLVGNIKLMRPLEDLEPVDRPALKLPAGVHVQFTSRNIETNEINLIGSNAADALERLDKFLDDAFLAQMGTVRVVHGTGMGVLMKAVAEFLRKHPHVAHFEQAPPAQGGRGATIVTLKD